LKIAVSSCIMQNDGEMFGMKSLTMVNTFLVESLFHNDAQIYLSGSPHIYLHMVTRL